jgi:hypothetical protein
LAHKGPAPACAKDVATAFIDQLDANKKWVLVPHSNAGLFVPAIAAPRQVLGAVYVDARLPQGAKRFPMSSPESLTFLASLADEEGMLPPWGEWWGVDISALSDTRVR